MQAPVPVVPAPPPFVRRWTPRRVFLATLAVVSVVAGFYLLYLFSNVLFVVFVAAVFATAMRPAVLWLERRRIPLWGGVLLIYLALAAVGVGVLAVMIPLLADQGTQMVNRIPGYYTDLRDELQTSNSHILRRVGNNLPARLDLSSAAGTTQQQATAAGEQESMVAQAVGAIRSVGWSLFGFIAIFLIAYFWTLDRDQIVRTGLLIVPIDYREEALALWDTVEQKVGAYIRGQALLMLSIGVLSTIAFFLIGLPSALILGVLAGILEAIPFLGPILTALVAVMLTLAEAPDKIWWVVGATVAIQQVENAFLVPRIMDRTVGVNAIVTLLAIAAFGTLLGLLGAILSIPMAAIIQVLLDHWVLHRDEVPVTIEGRDKVAVVRYQAQDLAQDLRERIRARPAEGDDDDTFEERLEAVVGEIDQLLMQVSTATTQAPGPST